jgi:hypothetical protein
LTEFLKNYNALGKVIAGATYDQMSVAEKKKSSVDIHARNLNLQLDDKLSKNLQLFSGFFRSNSYEVDIIPYENDESMVFHGVLNKEFLRIEVDRLRYLYGNKPNVPWVMVGQLTRSLNANHENNVQNDEANDKDGLLNTEMSFYDTLVNMFNATTEVENVFIESKKFKKIYVAPLAIYLEHELDIESSSVQANE